MDKRKLRVLRTFKWAGVAFIANGYAMSLAALLFSQTTLLSRARTPLDVLGLACGLMQIAVGVDFLLKHRKLSRAR